MLRTNKNNSGKRITFFSFVVWVLCLLAFFGSIAIGTNFFQTTVQETSFGNSKYFTNILISSFVVGVIFFNLMVFSYFISDKKNKETKSEEKVTKAWSSTEKFLLIGFLFLLVSALFLNARQMYLSSTQKKESEKMLQEATQSPTPLPTSTLTAKPNYNTDPITDCVSSHPSCNSESLRLKSSQCKNIFCCGFADGTWELYPSEEKCKQAWESKKPTTQIQKPIAPTGQLNFYCYDNTLKYSYYTSSGEQCNRDNLRSSCKEIAKYSVWEPCAQKCKDTDMQDFNICLASYSGSNALIEDNPALFQECSSEVTDEYTKCLDSCQPAYQEALNKCN